MTDLNSKYPTISGGGGLFLKLNDGDTVKVRLYSDPVYFDSEFKGNLSARFAWVIWNHDEEKAQIWATNGATYNSIKDLVLDEEYGDPSEYDIKITRTGTEQQTRYSIRPGTQRYVLTTEQLQACKGVDIIEKIDKSDSTQHVMWLEEHREQKANPETPSKEVGTKNKDTVIEDISDQPINLDDIPF